MKVQERLISYVTVRTPSNEESETVPSSMCQFDLARKLEKEMQEWTPVFSVFLRDGNGDFFFWG